MAWNDRNICTCSHHEFLLCCLLVGYLLRAFNACPWDYEWYAWDFWGLICLEYAPLWFIGSMLVDQFVLPYTLLLQWQVEKQC